MSICESKHIDASVFVTYIDPCDVTATQPLLPIRRTLRQKNGQCVRYRVCLVRQCVGGDQTVVTAYLPPLDVFADNLVIPADVQPSAGVLEICLGLSVCDFAPLLAQCPQFRHRGFSEDISFGGLACGKVIVQGSGSNLVPVQQKQGVVQPQKVILEVAWPPLSEALTCISVKVPPFCQDPITLMGAFPVNPPLLVGQNIVEYAISPDAQRVVYRVDMGGVSNLFSAPILGLGPAVQLNPTLVAGGSVLSFAISADSQRVVYRADQDTDNVIELYSVGILGGPVIKLNPTLVTGGDVATMAIAPDSQRVVYVADQDTDNVLELYSVDIFGGAVIKLNPPLPIGGSVDPDFSIAADSQRVVYMAEQDTNNIIELYSVPILGGASIKLNGPLVAGGNVTQNQISLDSKRVVYLADQDTDLIQELYSVSILGGPVVKLNPPLAGFVASYAISADSKRVVYRATQDTATDIELYSVPILGGPTTKLNGPLVVGGDVLEAQIAPNACTVVYRADQDINDVNELYSVAITGGQVTKLNPTFGGAQDVAVGFVITADSKAVLYLANPNGPQELFRVSIVGGNSVRLNNTLVTAGAVLEVQNSQDAKKAVYRADQRLDGVIELYTVNIPVILGWNGCIPNAFSNQWIANNPPQ